MTPTSTDRPTRSPWPGQRRRPEGPHRPLGRSRTALIAAAAVVLAGVSAGIIQTASASNVGTGSDAVVGSVPAPSLASAESTTPVCDAPDLSGSVGPAPASTASPVATLVSPPGGVMGFTTTASDLYVNTGTQLITYTLSGTQVGSFALPAAFNDNQGPNTPVVDPSGNIYLADYYGQQIEKFSPTGTVLWNDTGVPNPQGLFGVQNGSTWELVDSPVGRPSYLVTPSSGTVTTTTYPLHVGGSGEEVYVQQESDGDLLLSGNGYVKTATAGGSLLATFGSASVEGHNQHTGSGAQFYLPGEATQGADGTVYAADQNNLWATNAAGELIGSTSFGTDNNGGPNLSMAFSNLYAMGSNLYFTGGAPFNDGADYISVVPIAATQSSLATVHKPTDELGWGASISTPQAGEYFPAGTPVTVDAAFDPEWVTNASHLELTYDIWNDATMTAESPPASTTFPLPTSAAALASIPLTIPASDQASGPYQVQATLTDTSSNPPRSLGTTCMPYTVGAPGDGLDLASLPSGIGAGGPDDPRGVALNAQLGLDGLRSSTNINWSTFLPHCSASAPTAATCGSAAMTFTSAPIDYFEAAALADQDHVAYWIQVTGGDATSQALVTDGWWGQDIQALVNYYAHPPAGCTTCAAVTNWEPWNEANNTGWSNGATYVSSVLAPFYRAVKAVLPGSSSTVIGGSSLDVAYGWWSQIVGAGGLADMDVASIHPYPGNNDSFEEDLKPAQIKQLQSLLGSKPVWFSEVAWWSDGDLDYLAQADDISRVLLWMKALGVTTWNYYFDEGSWGDDGISYSLIQTDSGGDDYVKPAALATMETSQMMAGRSYLSQPTTGIPQTYAETFGPTTGGSTDVTAVWSDQLNSTAAVTVDGGGAAPVTVTDEYGNATTSTVATGTAYSLPVTSQITWIAYPAGDTLSVAAPEAYGANLALLSNGATGTASSGNPGAALSGLATGCCNGWTSSGGDTAPWLAVTWPTSTTVDRVVVDTQSEGSVAPGIRDYTVSADEHGTWTQLAQVTGQFRNHQELLTFSPVAATGVRVNVSTVNFGGYYGGVVPPWWYATQPDGAFLHALQVYAGTDTPAQVAGSGLTPLVDGTGQSPPALTTTTVTSSADPTAVGSSVSFTATVTSASAPPSGTVSFSAGGTPISGCTAVTLSAGQATCTDGDLAVGTTTVAAAYAPADQTTADSSGRLTQVVTGDRTDTALAATPTVFAPGSPVTLIATVTPPAATGTVGFSANGSAIPQCMAVALQGGTATCTVVPPHPGAWSYGASYHGDVTYAPSASPAARISVPGPAPGLWMVGSDGGIFSYGAAAFDGSTGNITLNRQIVGMAATPDGKGYWLVASDGGIFSFGDAGFYGSTGNLVLNRPIVGMAATPDGKGYWLVASDGGIFSFGDAGFYGSTGNLVLNRPIVGMAATPDGKGYWLVASDGGIFSFGDAGFAGSAGNVVLNRPIVGMATTPSGNGYWLVASDGGIFSFGDAGFSGSTAAAPPAQPVVSLVPTSDGGGYWEVTAGGAVFPFGDASALGSTAGLSLNRPVVGAAAP